MKKLFILSLAAFIIIATGSCKKEKEDPKPAPTKTELLTNKNWKVTAATVDPAYDWNGSGTLVTNVYTQMDACDRDNLTRFNTDGSLIYDEGASKCDPSDPQTSSGDWLFSLDQTILTIDGDSYTVQTLTETQLVIKQSWVENSVTYTLTMTFTKQ